jgi:hypothetical protein
MALMSKKEEECFQGFKAGDFVLYLEDDNMYQVYSRYFTPFSNKPYLVIHRVGEWVKITGILTTICSVDHVVKLAPTTSLPQGGGRKAGRRGKGAEVSM